MSKEEVELILISFGMAPVLVKDALSMNDAAVQSNLREYAKTILEANERLATLVESLVAVGLEEIKSTRTKPDLYAVKTKEINLYQGV